MPKVDLSMFDEEELDKLKKPKQPEPDLSMFEEGELEEAQIRKEYGVFDDMDYNRVETKDFGEPIRREAYTPRKQVIDVDEEPEYDTQAPKMGAQAVSGRRGASTPSPRQKGLEVARERLRTVEPLDVRQEDLDKPKAGEGLIPEFDTEKDYNVVRKPERVIDTEIPEPEQELSPIENIFRRDYLISAKNIEREKEMTGNKDASASFTKGLADNAVVDLIGKGVNFGYNVLVPENLEYNKEDIKGAIDEYTKEYEENKSTIGEVAGNAVGLMTLLATGEGALEAGGVFTQFGVTGLQGQTVTQNAIAEIGRGMIAETGLKMAQIGTGEYTPTEALKQIPKELLFETLAVGIGKQIAKFGGEITNKTLKQIDAEKALREAQESAQDLIIARGLNDTQSEQLETGIKFLRNKVDELQSGKTGVIKSIEDLKSEYPEFNLAAKTNVQPEELTEATIENVPKNVRGLVKITKNNEIDTSGFKRYYEVSKKNEADNIFSEMRERTNEPVDLLESDRKFLEEIEGKDYDELTELEKTHFNQTVKRLSYARENFNNFKSLEFEGSIDEVITDGVSKIRKSNPRVGDEPLDEIPKLSSKIDEAFTKGEASVFREWKLDFHLNTMDDMSLARMIDREGDVLVPAFEQMQKQYYDETLRVKNDLEDIFRASGVDLRNTEKLESTQHLRTNTKLGDETYELPMSYRVSLKLAGENDTNLKEMARAGIYLDKSGTDKVIKMDETALKEQIDSITLTDNEQRLYDAFKDVRRVGYEYSNPISKKLYGTELNFVENYFPLIRRGDAKAGRTFNDLRSSMDEQIFKQRTGSNKPVKIESLFKVSDRYINQVSDAQLEPAIRDIYRVINSKDFDSVIKEIYGVNEKGLSPIHKRIAKQISLWRGESIDPLSSQSALSKGVSNIISKMGMAKLAVNNAVPVKQVFSYNLASEFIDNRYLVQSLGTMRKADKDYILKNAPEMVDRAKGRITRATAETYDLGAGHGEIYDLATFGMIQRADMATVSRIYHGAKLQTIAKSGLDPETPEFKDEWLKLARKALRTQPNYGRVNVSPIVKSQAPTAKVATMFNTIFERMKNRIFDNAYQVDAGVVGSKRQLAKVIGGISASLMGASAFTEMTKRISSSGDYEERGNFLEETLKGAGTSALNISTLLGDLIATKVAGYDLNLMVLSDIDRLFDGLGDIVSSAPDTFGSMAKKMSGEDLSPEEVEELNRMLESSTDVADVVSSAKYGISPKTVKRSVDIIVGALDTVGILDSDIRVDVQTFGEPQRKTELLNKLESLPSDSDTALSIGRELSKLEQSQNKKVFEDIDVKYSQKMQEYILGNAREVNKTTRIYNNLDAIDQMSQDTTHSPEELVNGINDAYRFYKENKDTPRFKDWSKKEMVMYRLMNNNDLKDGKNKTYTTTARRIGDLVFGYNVDDREKYPVEQRGRWQPSGK